MRLLLALLTVSACVHAGWSPFKADPAPAAAPPSPPAEPQIGIHHQVPPEALFAQQDVPAPTPVVAASPSVTKRQPLSLPTANDWFNGDKPLAHQPHHGPEYRWKRLVFRPLLFKQEALAALGLVLFSLFCLTSRSGNKARAEAWLEANRTTLEEAFASVEPEVFSQSETKYSLWSSGRKGLAGLQTTVEFKPRGDPWSAAWTLVRTLMDFNYVGPQDKVVFDFVLADDSPEHGVNDNVMAVVTRSGMQKIKNSRWDTRALTTLSISTSNKVPQTYAVFQETSVSAENTLKAMPALTGWLNGEGQGQELLQSVVVSDIGSTLSDPSEEQLASSTPYKKSRRVTVTLLLPSSTSQYGELSAPLRTAIDSVDALTQSKAAIMTQTDAAKIKRRRLEIAEDITKEYKKELAETSADRAREAKKKEAEARYNAMTPQQQAKVDALEKKRLSKKSSAKMSVTRK